MCGITGLFNKNGNVSAYRSNLIDATKRLIHRGPDNTGHFESKHVLLGQTRLSVIDTSEAANQPFTDISGRYTLVFNGEIYNFKEIKKHLNTKGVCFKTNSDTEVLLYSYIHYGETCLERLNGFFAFAIYDQFENSLFIARDRMGIKPLYYFADNDQFIFGSELKSLLSFKKIKKIDQEALFYYLQLNYIPEPHTIFKEIKKLKKGHYLKLRNGNLKEYKYYEPPVNELSEHSFDNAAIHLRKLIIKSVKKRMVSDVPIGSFLSGGLDSSVIAACARMFTDKLNTFSIGYKDEPIYDESQYAEYMAKYLGTEHTSFMLSNDDLFGHLYDVLDSIDEPFADSSSIAVSILSKHTKKHVTVALSGDGGDELFGGYNKHMADLMVRNSTMTSLIAKSLYPIWTAFPKSRNNLLSNVFRKLDKLGKGARMSNKDRYWEWCTFSSRKNALECLTTSPDLALAEQMKKTFLPYVDDKDINSVFANDIHLVLANDMLTKVDRMSMAHSLEVRVPLLDHEIVNFTMGLSSKFKIKNNIQKHILKEAFKDHIPKKIVNRKKHGFEVPLLKWFKGELFSKIDSDWLNEDKISEQGIFTACYVKDLKKRLFLKNSGDAPLDIWKLIVFQHWYTNYFEN